jgi:hypothetical protein
MQRCVGYALLNGNGDVIGVYPDCWSEDDAVNERADAINESEDWVRNQVVDCDLRWTKIEVREIEQFPEWAR